MAACDWNGARWWRFDFHAHTPCSEDYAKGSPQQEILRQRTATEWLLDFMKAQIDCVAITDHNSGEWIDELRKALEELRTDQPEGYRQIHLFPGVEISVNGGVHLLAIFGCDTTTSDIDSFLGAAGFSGKKGSFHDVTAKSFEEVVSEVERLGGIAIPAHVDENDRGLFEVQQGATLKQTLECGGIFAMEVLSSNYSKPEVYREKKLQWTEVLGSDSHHPSGNAGQNYPGSRFTWVKMGTPSLEGLHLALLDGSLSVRRSDEVIGNPNRHALLVMESIEVSNARYMGRAQPFTLRLNPWLNAVIGGRGTGKSSLIEFLRIALRRTTELPDELKPEFEKYVNVYKNRGDGGLLTDSAAICVIYRKNGTRFRLQWSPGGELDAIEEEQVGQGWRPAEGDVVQRFPIRMYSQKQIFHLAKSPLALLRVVDDAPEVDRRSWNIRWREEENRFLSLRAKAREIETGLYEEPRLKGELDDVTRMLKIFEKVGHADVLKSFQRRRRQQRAVETWEEGWADVGERLRQIAGDLVPDPLDDASLDLESDEDVGLREIADKVREELDVLREALENLAEKADGVRSGWQRTRNKSPWRQAVDAASRAYDSLRGQLDEEGAGDPSAYGELVQRRQSIEKLLQDLADRKKQVESLREQATASLWKLASIRRERTESRQSFLQAVLKDNRYVNIEVDPYGAKKTVEAEFRQLIQREGRSFEKDIGDPNKGGLLGEIYDKDNGMEDFKKVLATVRQKARDAGCKIESVINTFEELDPLIEENGIHSDGIEKAYGVLKQKIHAEDREEIDQAIKEFETQLCRARIESGIAELKQKTREIAADTHDPNALGDRRFAQHIGKLQPEALDRLDLWFPEDSLEVRYSPTGDGRNLRSIKEGSPGQKTAALLAFLLSYGEEPLVLDQPEDDLDNHLIYELIVTQLREVKQQRQILVVTHNPNIVVNGDAELVVSLAARGGGTFTDCEGSLQEKNVRDTICKVMEGGRDAFKKRYHRITLEPSHV